MALVDYSSESSSGEEDTAGHRSKRQKTSSDQQTATRQAISRPTSKSELPPLPSAFHDLYASTVRLSASDDPTLHQGRRRVNPHKVGSWPSHLYIEWHPTPTEQTTLTALVSTLQRTLGPRISSTPSTTTTTTPAILTSFLTSDLGAPQPLHISLSRPIVLTTPQKAAFLADLQSSLRASGVAPFALAPLDLEWHRGADSARSFLVLRVGDPKVREGPIPKDGEKARTNPQLAALLARSNALVTALGQPALYNDLALSRNGNGNGNGSSGAEVKVGDVDGAFHVSIAWSFAAPSAELRRLTAEAFHGRYRNNHDRSQGRDRDPDNDDGDSNSNSEAKSEGEETEGPTTTTFRDAVAAMRVRVDGVKVKIGNVVTHVPLPDDRARGRALEGGGIFGV
ncbi:U6 snRNA phosphodiesterase Usb1 [Nemania sp. NC0429]|nr:U6 snRNA phosphodiesterase Usb1 [Nemania sp. NC0429]